MTESTRYISLKYMQDVKMKPLLQQFVSAVPAILERKDMHLDLIKRMRDKLCNLGEEKTNQPRETAGEAVKAVEEEFSVQDVTQPITQPLEVHTRYNNVILQKNIVPPGYTELGRQNTNKHQQPTVIDNQSEVHVVTSSSAVNLVHHHQLCRDAGDGSDSDEDERIRSPIAVPQVPNDRRNVDVPTPNVSDIMDTMLNERNLELIIKLQETGTKSHIT